MNNVKGNIVASVNGILAVGVGGLFNIIHFVNYLDAIMLGLLGMVGSFLGKQLCNYLKRKICSYRFKKIKKHIIKNKNE